MCIFSRTLVRLHKSVVIVLVSIVFLLWMLDENLPFVSYGDTNTRVRNMDNVTTKHGLVNNRNAPGVTGHRLEFRVPNIVHKIWFGPSEKFTLLHAISLVSACEKLQPEVTYFHTDRAPLESERWRWAARRCGSTLQTAPVERKPVIGGRRVQYVEHETDYLRLQLLIKFGGIYLDNDVIVLQSFAALRRSHAVVADAGARPNTIHNSILLAERNATFLRLWLQEYDRDYRPSVWGYNSVDMAGQLYNQHPQMMHRMRGELKGSIQPPWIFFQQRTKAWYPAVAVCSIHINRASEKFPRPNVIPPIPQTVAEFREKKHIVAAVMRYIYLGHPLEGLRQCNDFSVH